MKLSKKAIIVEDNLILSVLYENYLKEMVFKTVGEIKDGESAIRLVKKYNPDVIIMDINLEGEINGIDAMHEIRKFSEVPVIFITGNSDPKTIHLAKEIAHSHFLIKPISEEKLKRAVDKMYKLTDSGAAS